MAEQPKFNRWPVSSVVRVIKGRSEDQLVRDYLVGRGVHEEEIDPNDQYKQNELLALNSGVSMAHATLARSVAQLISEACELTLLDAEGQGSDPWVMLTQPEQILGRNTEALLTGPDSLARRIDRISSSEYRQIEAVLGRIDQNPSQRMLHWDELLAPLLVRDQNGLSMLVADAFERAAEFAYTRIGTSSNPGESEITHFLADPIASRFPQIKDGIVKAAIEQLNMGEPEEDETSQEMFPYTQIIQNPYSEANEKLIDEPAPRVPRKIVTRRGLLKTGAVGLAALTIAGSSVPFWNIIVRDDAPKNPYGEPTLIDPDPIAIKFSEEGPHIRDYPAIPRRRYFNIPGTRASNEIKLKNIRSIGNTPLDHSKPSSIFILENSVIVKGEDTGTYHRRYGEYGQWIRVPLTDEEGKIRFGFISTDNTDAYVMPLDLDIIWGYEIKAASNTAVQLEKGEVIAKADIGRAYGYYGKDLESVWKGWTKEKLQGYRGMTRDETRRETGPFEVKPFGETWDDFLRLRGERTPIPVRNLPNTRFFDRDSRQVLGYLAQDTMVQRAIAQGGYDRVFLRGSVNGRIYDAKGEAIIMDPFTVLCAGDRFLVK